MERHDFFPLISNTWGQWIKGSPTHIWEQKLKITKLAIKQWEKNLSCPLHLKVLEKQKQLEEIQIEIEISEVHPTNLKREKEAHREYIKAIQEEETMWRLKSRSLWLKEGDKNTTFFHKQAKMRQWINNIKEIKDQAGETIQDFEQIKRKLFPL
jgi:hypothetical protein